MALSREELITVSWTKIFTKMWIYIIYKKLASVKTKIFFVGFLLRGPFLARFELCWKLQEMHIKTNDILGDTIELFIEFFRKFGNKPCCVSDLKIYLKLLDAEQKSELATKLVKEVGIGPTSVPQSVMHLIEL